MLAPKVKSSAEIILSFLAASSFLELKAQVNPSLFQVQHQGIQHLGSWVHHGMLQSEEGREIRELRISFKTFFNILVKLWYTDLPTESVSLVIAVTSESSSSSLSSSVVQIK